MRLLQLPMKLCWNISLTKFTKKYKMLTFTQEITAAGGTFTYDPQSWGGGSAIISITNNTGSPITLLNDFEVALSSLPNEGETLLITAQFEGNTVDLNGHQFKVCNGQNVPQYILDNPFINMTTLTKDGGIVSFFINDYFYSGIPGNLINAGTINATAIGELASGKIILGDGSNQAALVTPSGDVTIDNTGVTAIGSGVIVNADVNASAAIARTKLASGTASHVLINDGSGVMSSEATLAKSRGGFGQSVAASTGIVSFSSGTLNIGAMAEVITIPVSFESGEQCENCVKMPYAGTVTEIYAVCTKAIAGTDDATITAKNNAGTTMTGGVLTFTASDPLNTAYDVSPSANNTFVAGDVLQFVTAKTTSGGKALVSIKVTRNS